MDLGNKLAVGEVIDHGTEPEAPIPPDAHEVPSPARAMASAEPGTVTASAER